MANNRINQEHHEVLESFINMTPVRIPGKRQSLFDYNLPNTTTHNTAHEISRVKKSANILKAQRSNADYFIKKLSEGTPSGAAELEVANALLYRNFKIDIAPTYTSILNEHGKVTHVACKAIPNFSDWIEKPLGREIFEVSAKLDKNDVFFAISDNNNTLNVLYTHLQTLYGMLDRSQQTDSSEDEKKSPQPKMSSTFFSFLNPVNLASNVYQVSKTVASSATTLVKNQYLTHIASDKTAVQLQGDIDHFRAKHNKHTPEDITQLEQALQKRNEHILNSDHMKNEQKYKAEVALNNKIISILDLLLQPINYDALQKIELLYQDLESKNFNVLDDNLNSEGLQKMTIAAQDRNLTANLSIKNKDLKNYRLIRGLSMLITFSRCANEIDLHGHQFTREGLRIDFDKSNYDLAAFYNSITAPSLKPFVLTPADIINAPFIDPAHDNTHYFVHKTGITGDTFLPNGYNEEHNKFFKELGKHPIYQFIKYKSLLHYIMMTPEMINAMATLTISENTPDPTPGSKLSLRERFVEVNLKRIELYRSVLFSMPDFANFLAQTEDHMFDLVNYEFKRIREHFAIKAKNYPEYAELANAYDSEQLQERYHEIYLQAGAANFKGKPPIPLSDTLFEEKTPQFRM